MAVIDQASAGISALAPIPALPDGEVDRGALDRLIGCSVPACPHSTSRPADVGSAWDG